MGLKANGCILAILGLRCRLPRISAPIGKLLAEKGSIITFNAATVPDWESHPKIRRGESWKEICSAANPIARYSSRIRLSSLADFRAWPTVWFAAQRPQGARAPSLPERFRIAKPAGKPTQGNDNRNCSSNLPVHVCCFPWQRLDQRTASTTTNASQ